MNLPEHSEAKCLQLLQQYPLAATAEKNELLQRLATAVNELIASDFNRLVRILYRVDVSEKKLKHLLLQQPQTDAGLLIAQLLLQRQAEKTASRNSHRPNDAPGLEEERW